MQQNKFIKLCFLTLASLISISCCAEESTAQQNYPWYVGAMGGYGTTTWANLVPKNMSDAMMTSIPIRVAEGGSVWGFYGGYQFMPAFALELSYMQYPTADLYFDSSSLFSFDHDGRTKLRTHTSRIGLVGKFILAIPRTPLKAYSSFGPAEVHRNDAVFDKWRLSPMFGVGLIYDVNPHMTTELATEYVAGYGQSELDPAEHFIPFLYSVFLRVAYRF
jgi:hypothetical protein